MNPLKIAYIGFGKSTKRYHLPFVKINPNLQVVTAFDPLYHENAELQKEHPEIVFVATVDEILNDDNIELVSICTPPKTHYNLAKSCILAGKHALVEKPFCVNYKEAQELFALAQEKNVQIMAYQNRRFDGDFELLKKLVEEKIFGEIKEIQSSFDYYRPIVDDEPYIREDGAFYGMAVHLIDQIVSIFGVPEKVLYDIKSQRKAGTPDDYFHLQLLYHNGVKAILSLSHLKNYETPRFFAYGTEATLIKYGKDMQEFCLKNGLLPGSAIFGKDNPEHNAKLILAENEENNSIKLPIPIGDYGKIYQGMYETIRNHKEKIVSDEETLTVIRILDECSKNLDKHIFVIE